MQRVDEHQRRVVSQMLDEVSRYRSGDLEIRALVQNLQGLMGAADFHAERLRDEFWNVEAEISMEMELRTEAWAPTGSASDERLEDGLTAFVAWVNGLLSDADPTRA